MASKCRLCGAWHPGKADMMPPPEHLVRLYPFLGYLADAAGEYDRAAVKIKSGEMELSTAAEFFEWLDYEVRLAGGIRHGRSTGRASNGEALQKVGG